MISTPLTNDSETHFSFCSSSWSSDAEEKVGTAEGSKFYALILRHAAKHQSFFKDRSDPTEQEQDVFKPTVIYTIERDDL